MPPSWSRRSAGLAGWVNHARYGNTVGLRKAVLSSLPESLKIGVDTHDAERPSPTSSAVRIE
jgi:hypothetical protein